MNVYPELNRTSTDTPFGGRSQRGFLVWNGIVSFRYVVHGGAARCSFGLIIIHSALFEEHVKEEREERKKLCVWINGVKAR